MLSKFGNALKVLRINAGMSQTEFAKACGWPANSGRISQYETGRREPSAEDIRTMAKVLGVPASRLQFPEEDPMYQEGVARHGVARDRHRAVEVDALSVRKRLLDAQKLVALRAAEKRIKDQSRIDAATLLYAEYADMRQQAIDWLLAAITESPPEPSPDLNVVDWVLKEASENEINNLRDRIMAA